jgi:NAD(P)-dependent dehydrogenase (short-subunit alcohol dehydrogenase family)
MRTGRRLLVTGAASGIGRAVALLAAAREPGVSLALVDRDRAGLEDVASTARARGASVLTLVADLGGPDAPQAVVAEAIASLGGLDVLVANAGMVGSGPLREVTVESWQTIFDLNTRGPWLLARAAYDALAESAGSIVVSSSIAALHAAPYVGAYSPSKAAVSMLVRQLAVEWGPVGIRVNAVAPGPIVTPMTYARFGGRDTPAALERRARRAAITPLRRVGEAEDVAEVILFLAGPGARHLTGIEIPVDGGLHATLMPGARE